MRVGSPPIGTVFFRGIFLYPLTRPLGQRRETGRKVEIPGYCSYEQLPPRLRTVPNEIRVVERDGRRWLQQYRNRPDGNLYEYDWIDVGELAPLRSSVVAIRRSRGTETR